MGKAQLRDACWVDEEAVRIRGGLEEGVEADDRGLSRRPHRAAAWSAPGGTGSRRVPVAQEVGGPSPAKYHRRFSDDASAIDAAFNSWRPPPTKRFRILRFTPRAGWGGSTSPTTRNSAARSHSRKSGPTGRTNPLSVAGSYGRRRSTAAWSIPGSCRSTASAPLMTAGRSMPCDSSRATSSRRRSSRTTGSTPGPTGRRRIPQVAAAVRQRLRGDRLRPQPRGAAPRLDAAERDPGRVRRDAVDRLGTGQGDRPRRAVQLEGRPWSRPGASLGQRACADHGLLGTPAFMSPEQAAGAMDSLGPATDIYGLGAILFALLTGEAPVVGRTTEEVLDRVRAGVGSVNRGRSTPSIPRALEAVCLKALATEPKDRYRDGDGAGRGGRALAGRRAGRRPGPESVVVSGARRWARRHRALVTGADGRAGPGIRARLASPASRRCSRAKNRELDAAGRRRAEARRGDWRSTRCGSSATRWRSNAGVEEPPRARTRCARSCLKEPLEFFRELPRRACGPTGTRVPDALAELDRGEPRLRRDHDGVRSAASPDAIRSYSEAIEILRAAACGRIRPDAAAHRARPGRVPSTASAACWPRPPGPVRRGAGIVPAGAGDPRAAGAQESHHPRARRRPGP